MRILALSLFAALTLPSLAFAEHSKDHPPQHDKQAMFDRADANKDGSLSRAEVDAFHEKMKDHREQRQDRRDAKHDGKGIPVATLDANKDGFISREEHQAVREKHRYNGPSQQDHD